MIAKFLDWKLLGDESDNDDREDEYLDFVGLNGFLLPKLEREGLVVPGSRDALQWGCGRGCSTMLGKGRGHPRGKGCIRAEASA